MIFEVRAKLSAVFRAGRGAEKQLPQNPNPTIKGFRQRVEWITANLDPNPKYARFASETEDVFTALGGAIQRGLHTLRRDKKTISRRSWETALGKDNVSPDFVQWLCALYPDLTIEHLLEPDLEIFFARGQPIQEARKRWSEAARLYSANRKKLLDSALSFYAEVQDRSLDQELGVKFPLLVRPGWVRSAPLRLEEGTELKFLHTPNELRQFSPAILPGLLGNYATYRGNLGFGTRRKVKPEPQHNGEILCANSVIMDEGSFVGFVYDLGLYFDYLNTSEILGAELAKHILDTGQTHVDPTFSFPLRGTPSDAFELTNRAAYPGVNCLTVFLNYTERGLPRGNWILLHKRDETQLQAQNSLHVVPAGGHQGFAKGAQREDTAIWRTVVREFAEELFDQEDLNKQPETWFDFVRHPDVERIKRRFFDGPRAPARIFLHGFGLDPITLKPEIICTIVVDCSMLTSSDLNLKFNWELQTNDPKVTRHQWVRLSREGLIREATERRQTVGDKPLDALPAGAACMLLTAKYYDALGLPD